MISRFVKRVANPGRRRCRDRRHRVERCAGGNRFRDHLIGIGERFAVIRQSRLTQTEQTHRVLSHARVDVAQQNAIPGSGVDHVAIREWLAVDQPILGRIVPHIERRRRGVECRVNFAEDEDGFVFKSRGRVVRAGRTARRSYDQRAEQSHRSLDLSARGQTRFVQVRAG